ncbi:MAG: hypothetical protein ACKVOU_06670 [Cytophagales bacterium]
MCLVCAKIIFSNPAQWKPKAVDNRFLDDAGATNCLFPINVARQLQVVAIYTKIAVTLAGSIRSLT